MTARADNLEYFVGGLALIRQGSAARATSATKLNDVSSRSHAIFVIIVEQQHVQQDPDTGASREVFTVAKLNFVDLAGSERVCACSNSSA